MTIRVLTIDFFRVPMQTRFPFRYGIASLTELSHLLVLVTVECDGKTGNGISGDGLPPKWFTKDPDSSFEHHDLPEMLGVIRHAADTAMDLATQPDLFTWWLQLYTAQQKWAKDNRIAPLLAGFGVSLIEAAVIDACCRVSGQTLFQSLKSNSFGIDLGAARPSLSGLCPADCLPETPLVSVRLRHTIGLSDPLITDEIDLSERLDDGLPHCLVDSIRSYGLQYFKIKLQGDLDRDRDRLMQLATLIPAHAVGPVRFTLDANEQYRDIESFRNAWESLRGWAIVRQFIDQSLLFVEQPLHRDGALEEEVAVGLRAWPDRPPIIIDESDASLDSLPTALRIGYSGTSHKNCKGIFKGLVNAATIKLRSSGVVCPILSAEDLANVGPVALMQDLAMVAALSIDHVERNGHHYFAGLSMFDEDTQRRVIADHPDLFGMSGHGFATLSPVDGRLSLRTINASPFGVAEIPNVTAMESWDL